MPTTTNFGWTTPADTDLVKDGAAAIRTLGNGIDTSLLDLKGGTTGQVLSKTSNTDLDFTWVTTDDANAIQNAIVDAKGDLITATAADTPSRLAVGSNGTVLTAASGETTGLKWSNIGKTLLSTTTLSGTSTVVSNISQDYTDLEVVVYGATATSASFWIIRPNSSSSTFGNRITRSSTANTNDSGSDLSIDATVNLRTTGGLNITTVTYTNYAATSYYKKYFLQSFFESSAPANTATMINGAYLSNTAITSIQVAIDGSATGGTLLIYGIK